MTFEELVHVVRAMPVFVRDGKLVYRCPLTEQQKSTLKFYKPELIRALTKPYPGSRRYAYTMESEEGGVVRIIHHHRDMDYLHGLLGPGVQIRPCPEKPARSMRNVRNHSTDAA